jgi:hypothetical protein
VADFDFSELSKLAADLGTVPQSTQANTRKAVEVTARKVKDSWRNKLRGSEYLPGLPRVVSYDIEQPGGAVEAEVGFTKHSGQGDLGNVSEFGVPGRTGPRGFGLASLKENEEDFVKGIGLAVDDTLKDAGL